MPEVQVNQVLVAPPIAPTSFEPFPEPFAKKTGLRTRPGPRFISISEPQPEKPARRDKLQPIYVVSDLHLGDGGPRDNFAYMSGGRRIDEFLTFLNFVEDQNGQLIIAGDFFELWQSNMSEVLTLRIRLLDRLAKMKAIYILGNHDADLCYFCTAYGEEPWINHQFFETMRQNYTLNICGTSFHFIHGHEVDSYCSGSIPGLGRITAIYTGLREDRNGSPLLNKYKTVEARSIGRLERVSNFFRWFLGKPNRTRAMNNGLCEYIREYGGEYDVLVSGHTHRAGQLYSKKRPLPIYNSGTWAEGTCSFVAISPMGRVGVFDWIDNQPVPNLTEIKI